MSDVCQRFTLARVSTVTIVLCQLFSLACAHELIYSDTCRENYTVQSSDGLPLYSVFFKDRGQACSKSREGPDWGFPSIVNLMSKPKFHVQTEHAAESDRYTLRISWNETGDIPRKQNILFKAKFDPDYAVRPETRRCVGVRIRRLSVRTPTEVPVSLDCLQIPPGEIGSLEIIPVNSQKRMEVADFDSVCRCEDQTAEVFFHDCRLDLFLRYVTDVTKYHVTVTRLGHDENLVDVRKIRENGKELLPLGISVPGNYTVKISFWCQSGRHGNNCRIITTHVSLSEDCKAPETQEIRQKSGNKAWNVSSDIVAVILVSAVLLLVTIGTVGYFIYRCNRRSLSQEPRAARETMMPSNREQLSNRTVLPDISPSDILLSDNLKQCSDKPEVSQISDCNETED